MQSDRDLQLDHQGLDNPDLEVEANEFSHLIQRRGVLRVRWILHPGVGQMYL